MPTLDQKCVRCKATWALDHFPLNTTTGVHRRICLLCYARIPRKSQPHPRELRTYESPSTRKKLKLKRNLAHDMGILLEAIEEDTATVQACPSCKVVTNLFTTPKGEKMCQACEDREHGEA